MLFRLIKKIYFLRFLRNYFLYVLNKPHHTEIMLINKLKQDLKKYKGVHILALGKSINDHTINNQTMPKNLYYVGLSRWVFHNFTPDLLYFEIANTKGSENFCNTLIEKLNQRVTDYKNTIIVCGNYENKKWCLDRVSEINNTIDKRLSNNFFFIRNLPIGARSKKSFELFINFFEIFKRLKILRIKFYHSRGSIVCLVMLFLQLKTKNIWLSGVDGYSGYFGEKNSKFFGDYGAEKNLIGELHSTCDPKFGHPTVPECIEVLSYNKTEVSSKKTLQVVM